MLEHLREALEEPASEGWEAGLTGEVRPTLRPVSKGNVSGTGFSGFLPGPSIPLSGDHGSWQRWQLPVGGCPITHPPGVLPRATEPGSAGMGKEAQLSLPCRPGVNRWDVDLPLP